MCVLFMYNGWNDPDSDYSFIMISNRDESYDRPSKNMEYWSVDSKVIGGIDLGVHCTSTWLALSPVRRKLGVILNLPGYIKENPLSRGKIVSGYVTGEKHIEEYVEEIKKYDKDCNGFIFVSVEFGSNNIPKVYAYNNVSNDLTSYTDSILAFGNSLPDRPLKKVEAGKKLLKETFERHKKIDRKKELIDEFLKLLKSEESHLPDPELESRRPTMYKQLSSIYVCVPDGRYGSRTHTILLVTKNGDADLVEITMQMPIDPLKPIWEKTDFQFSI